jgi:thiol-disulfide isomerase/thioredoxin
MRASQLLLSAILAGAFAAPGVSFAQEGSQPQSQPQRVKPRPSQLPVEGDLPAAKATEWLNTPPLTGADLRGKVILIDFWTYSCVNWRRTLPYVRAWAAKYKSDGLVVIGVHTPEFEFEKNIDNIRRAAKEMKIDYPIAVDSDREIWRAFNNDFWPALYFVDSQGRIRHHYLGEGEYEHSERVIQQLLAEAGFGGFDRKPVAVRPIGVEAAADLGNLKSPETYTGAERTQNFASPSGPILDRPATYEIPAHLKLNHWALAGVWTVRKDAIAVSESGARLAFRFHCRDLNIVMGPRLGGTSNGTSPGRPLRFRVLLNGKPPGPAHGTDVDAEGNGTATEQRLYQIIHQQRPIADRQFEIQFLDPDVEVFSFTFG